MQLRTRAIPVSDMSLTALERAYLLDAFDSGRISGTGPYVGRFERAFAEWVGRSNAVACTNGTVALEAALRVLGIGRGDEVVMPALTFAACSAVVKHVGATPVFVDIDADTWTLDPAAVKAALTPHTKAVMAVDLIGHPCDYDGLAAVLPPTVTLIEDAAEAHGARYKGALCGSFGAVSTFSFFPNKVLGAGEGGCIVTDDDLLADRLRIFINHGVRLGRAYDHVVVGSNFRMTALHCAIGLAQLERRDELIAARAQVGRWYDDLLPSGYTRRPVADWATESMWFYTTTHPERERIAAALKARGIDTRPMFPVLPDLPIYAAAGDFPEARRVSREGLMLPTSPLMTEDDVQYICTALREATCD